MEDYKRRLYFYKGKNTIRAVQVHISVTNCTYHVISHTLFTM